MRCILNLRGMTMKTKISRLLKLLLFLLIITIVFYFIYTAKQI